MFARSVPAMLVVALAMFGVAPYFIVQAPLESTMGLVQKIFYFHVPAAIMMFLATFTCGFASLAYLAKGRARSDRLAEAAAELTVLFGLIVLVTGPIWARKAWGFWWQWDARLTSTLVLWLLFSAYLLLRRFGGPGTEKLAAGVAVFGMVNVPFIYWSVNVWRTMHPKTTVVPSLGPEMRFPLYWCMVAFLLLYLALLQARVRLAEQQDSLDLLLAEAEG
jgi:heme exporter protein C